MELNKRGSDFQYRWPKNYIKKNKFEYIIKSIRGNIIWSCDNHSSCSEFSCVLCSVPKSRDCIRGNAFPSLRLSLHKKK